MTSNGNSEIPLIAIVDDDKTFRFIFSMQLHDVNPSFKIQQFDDGYNILEYLLENKENSLRIPDIIFLDLNMKQKDGWVFLEEYATISKFLPKNITILILTGSEEASDRMKAASNVLVSEFIQKPVTNSRLAELLKVF